MILIDEVFFEELKKGADYSSLSINDDLMKDKDLWYLLERYLLLTHFSKGIDIQPIQVYYNRYYWFMKFTAMYLKKYGEDDLNLRQEGFKILEEGERFDDIDWSEIEKISNSFKDDDE